MGIVLAALAGAGGQAIDLADKSIAQDQALQREKFTSDLAMTRDQASSDLAQQRAEALELFKNNEADRQRSNMVQRVDTAAGQIADTQMAPKLAQEQAGIVDQAAWTPEQQAAVDQSNALDKQGLVNRAKTDGSAGLATGDVTPKDAMGNASKLEINQLKMDNLLSRAADRNQTMQEVANVRADAMRYGYELRLRAAEEKRTSGKIDTATGRMLITSEDANIKASTNQMLMLQRELENTSKVKDGKPNPRIDDINQQISSLRDDINTSKSNKEAYLTTMGIMPPKAATPTPGGNPMGPPADAAGGAAVPTPAASAPGTLPPGWGVRVLPSK